MNLLSAASSLFQTTPAANRAPSLKAPESAPPATTQAARPDQLLQGSPGSNPANAGALTQMQADTAARLTGPTTKEAEKAAAQTLTKKAILAKAAGPVGNAIGAAFQVYETGSEIKDIQQNGELSQSEKQQQAGKSALKGAGSISGSLGGALAGATLGAFAGPPGMLIGGILGGIAGDFAGSEAGEALGGTGMGAFVGKLFA